MSSSGIGGATGEIEVSNGRISEDESPGSGVEVRYLRFAGVGAAGGLDDELGPGAGWREEEVFSMLDFESEWLSWLSLTD